MENRECTKDGRTLCLRPLRADEIGPALLKDFVRRQEVTLCLRRVDGAWAERPDPFIDDWDDAERADIADDLAETLRAGGLVLGALEGGALKGFASVKAAPLGSEGQYRDLTMLHVSADRRGEGIGRALFLAAASWARAHGGKKLYISAHSAVETQRFYESMGCTDAAEPSPAHVAAEPYDRQMEAELT